MKIKPIFNFVPAVAVTLTVILAGCSKPADTAETSAPASTNVTLTATQRQRVQLQTVKVSKFFRTIDTSGTVGFDSDQATTIIAPISGPMTKMLVPLGTDVKAGDPLALIDSPDFATDISAYRKALATSTNTRRIANLDEDLFKHGALAHSALEQAQTDAINADADTEAALQQVHSLGVSDQMIDDMRHHVVTTNLVAAIRSPIDGTLVERLVTPGQLIQANTTPCFTVADLSQMWVMPNVFESDLPYVAVGDPAEIITSADPQKIPGSVDNISAIVDPNTRSIGVRIVAKNPGGVLKKQMYVRVLIHSSRESTGLLAPVSSVLRNDENLPFVYLAGADGTFSRREVVLGSRVNEDYEITSGLADGDQIVTDGGLFVQFLQNQ